MADRVDVDVDYSWEGDERLYAVSLSTDTWLAVIHIPLLHLSCLRKVSAAIGR